MLKSSIVAASPFIYTYVRPSDRLSFLASHCDLVIPVSVMNIIFAYDPLTYTARPRHLRPIFSCIHPSTRLYHHVSLVERKVCRRSTHLPTPEDGTIMVKNNALFHINKFCSYLGGIKPANDCHSVRPSFCWDSKEKKGR